MDKSAKEHWDIVYNPNYRFNDNYGIAYLTPESYVIVSDSLSALRRSKDIESHCYHVIANLFKIHYHNYFKIKDLDHIQPRIIAQKFIGRKKIRNFIFNRDKICLRCGTDDALTIDHIEPISKGGENKLSNLQTLCKSCNSIKKDNFKDFRYGGR